MPEVGNCYRFGIGVDKNKRKSCERYFSTAESGDSYGRNNLDSSCGKDLSDLNDDEKVFRRHLKSAKRGNPNGQFNVEHCYEN